MSDPVRLGVVGLGRGFALSARAFAESPHLRLVAAADPLPGPRAAFVRAFGGRSYPDVAALAADPEVEAVYVATPHGLHRAHAETAFRAGKHVLVEKPIAVTLADAEAMVAAAAAMGVHLIVGPCHSFDAPVRGGVRPGGASGGCGAPPLWWAGDIGMRPGRRLGCGAAHRGRLCRASHFRLRGLRQPRLFRLRPFRQRHLAGRPHRAGHAARSARAAALGGRCRGGSGAGGARLRRARWPARAGGTRAFRPGAGLRRPGRPAPHAARGGTVA
ncbi:MAG: hypothetical protein CVT80_10330 [Alphaproteobacteria bacterium HGW-Alphaproteobacteria-2]|nr:MAG: hypothetical protein CVT80_10330 [Alphaproteobacteria bacterium HGW-Alphaproteobacteria-2]